MKLRILPLLLIAAGSAGAADSVAIKINQVGFAPGASKVAVAPASASAFEVVRADSGATVHKGVLTAAAKWAPSGETVKLADFSALTTPGEYRLKIDGVAPSDKFVIKQGVYAELAAASIRAYYINRASIPIEAKLAGVHARAAGHPDDKVLVHKSAASKARPTGTVISSPKGWYDAGDYNKYIVNSGITTYTLLAAFEHFPDYFTQQKVGLPESGNGLPDLLNEAMWNLEWMLTMQDPADGGVYHKLTNLRFDAMVMPDKAVAPRYVVAKGTAAALDFAAVMATAARVMKPYDKQYPGLAAKMLTAAEQAYQWAVANPKVLFKNPSDVATGEYGDEDMADEFAWAAAELYISTGKDSYYTAMKPVEIKASPEWANVAGLGWMSLAHHRQHLSKVADQKLIASRIDAHAAKLAAQWKNSAYGVTMQPADFVWGSNAVVLNQAMMLLQGYRLNGNTDYMKAAQANLDYVLGRNATAYSFVTGFGARPVMFIHHRPSEADKIAAPVPGFLSGGPNPGQQDKNDCKGVQYPSSLPALSFIDHMCSYAANEIAINWNAPLVYVSAAVDALSKGRVR